MIRQLQAQAAKHGELLDGFAPADAHFESLLRIQQPREEQVSGLFNEEIDLFAEVRDTLHSPESQETGYQAHKMWINHVRQWCRDENNARPFTTRSPYVKAGCRHSSSPPAIARRCHNAYSALCSAKMSVPRSYTPILVILLLAWICRRC